MPDIDQMRTTAMNYNREFQEMTARIDADGLITCQEATEGTSYYKSVRPRIRRIDKHIRRYVRYLFSRYTTRLLTVIEDDKQRQWREAGNQHLLAYRGTGI